jgi:iron complex transport system permease protein
MTIISKYWSLSIIIPLIVIVLSLVVGINETGFKELWEALTNPNETQNLTSKIILEIRLPRVLLAFITGGILSVSGAAMQAVFRNPMVDPYIMGISSGAAFGAALAIVLPIINVQLSAFIFGLSAVMITYFIAKNKNTINTITLILSGIIVNGVFTAFLTILQVWSDPFKLQSIVHWIMGSFQNADISDISTTFLPCLIGTIIIFLYSWKLDILSIGDEEARSSGINVLRTKSLIIGAAALASSAVVSVTGVIGLYGLVIPHFVRMIFGVSNRQTLIINFTIGGTFLLLIDDIVRNLGGYEIPVGVLTMLFSSPIFIFLIKKYNTGWR